MGYGYRQVSLKVFDYYCGACSVTSELWLNNDETPVCPECGSTEVVKVFTKGPHNHTQRSEYDRLDTYHDYLTEPIRSVVPKSYKGGKG